MKQEIEKMKSRLLLLAFILMVPIGVFAQNITVKGNVTDSEGEPIIGATVMEKGKSQNGVITDLDGNFTLNVSGKGKKIVITYIGMKTEEVDAVTGKTLKIVLKDDSQTLDEVVVVAVGYGNARKKDLTGAISSVGEKTLKNIPTTLSWEIPEKFSRPLTLLQYTLLRLRNSRQHTKKLTQMSTPAMLPPNKQNQKKSLKRLHCSLDNQTRSRYLPNRYSLHHTKKLRNCCNKQSSQEQNPMMEYSITKASRNFLFPKRGNQLISVSQSKSERRLNLMKLSGYPP